MVKLSKSIVKRKKSNENIISKPIHINLSESMNPLLSHNHSINISNSPKLIEESKEEICDIRNINEDSRSSGNMIDLS